MVASIYSLQKRIRAPSSSKTPLCPLAFGNIGIWIGWRRRGGGGTGTWRLRQDIVSELDDTRAERLARFVRRTEIRSVFLAYDRILRERLGEDSVDNGLCRIVGHFFFEMRALRVSLSEPPPGLYILFVHGAPVTGLLSPLTSVSPATSLLKIVVVSAHALRTAAMATCCSRANGTGMMEEQR